MLTLTLFLQLEISKEGEGKEDDQGKAFAALAAAHQQLGDLPKAVECLEKFLRIAQDSENLAQQAEACANLGVVHGRARSFADSIKYFEQAYELCRTMLASGVGACGVATLYCCLRARYVIGLVCLSVSCCFRQA